MGVEWVPGQRTRWVIAYGVKLASSRALRENAATELTLWEGGGVPLESGHEDGAAEELCWLEGKRREPSHAWEHSVLLVLPVAIAQPQFFEKYLYPSLVYTLEE